MWLESSQELPTNSAIIAKWLWDAFEAGVRRDTFDRLLDVFPGLLDRWTTQDLVLAYREHAPDIGLIPGWEETLGALAGRGVRLAVLSDGPAISQSAKAEALGLSRWFDPIVLTDTFGPRYAKPGTAGFRYVADTWGFAGSTLAYVGDNPEKDFYGPRRLGWTTIRFRNSLQLRDLLEPVNATFSPDIEVRAPTELLEVLDIVR